MPQYTARMFRPLRVLALASALLCAGSASAQTYQPQAIRFEGTHGEDQSRLLAITGLTPGQPVTKEQIEAALGKLADTGSFSDISYTVSRAALVITLGGAEDSGQLPVRFTNFVWWQPADLEHLLETEVPLYHGELSLTGSLTSQVEATLVKLAKAKGLDIRVTALREPKTLALSIERPPILVGAVQIDDVQPAFGPKMSDFKAGLHGKELDLQTTTATVQHDAAEIFRDAGYLDATVDAPVYAAPKLNAKGGYEVDVKAAVHPGEIYKVVQLKIAAAAPLTEDQLRPAAELKPGDPASPMGLLITGQKLAHVYASHGYLDAVAMDSTSLDNAAHTASYAIGIEPHSLYHLSGIVAGSLPVDAQAALAQDKRLAPGLPAGMAVVAAIQDDLRPLYAGRPIVFSQRIDRLEHTVSVVVEFSSGATR